MLISFGGLLADLVVSVDAVPERGADALARDFTQTIGGGFSVVAAAARPGMPTALAGVLGEDPIADAARRALRDEASSCSSRSHGRAAPASAWCSPTRAVSGRR